MSYGHNYYNYQIAIIFVILIAALLLLGAIIAGIYFVASSMRSKKETKKRPPPMARSQPVWQPSFQEQQFKPQQYSPISAVRDQPTFTDQGYGRSDEQTSALSRPSPQASHFQPQTSFQPQSQYYPQEHQQQQQPPQTESRYYHERYPIRTQTTQPQQVKQQYSEQPARNVQELQPEYSYQQGPTTWTNVSPVVRTTRQEQQTIIKEGYNSYHMSSV